MMFSLSSRFASAHWSEWSGRLEVKDSLNVPNDLATFGFNMCTTFSNWEQTPNNKSNLNECRKFESNSMIRTYPKEAALSKRCSLI